MSRRQVFGLGREPDAVSLRRGWREPACAGSPRSRRSRPLPAATGRRSSRHKLSTRRLALPSVCIAMSQIGRLTSRSRASGARAGQSTIDGRYGLWVSSSMRQKACLCASLPRTIGPVRSAPKFGRRGRRPGLPPHSRSRRGLPLFRSPPTWCSLTCKDEYTEHVSVAVRPLASIRRGFTYLIVECLGPQARPSVRPLGTDRAAVPGLTKAGARYAERRSASISFGVGVVTLLVRPDFLSVVAPGAGQPGVPSAVRRVAYPAVECP